MPLIENGRSSPIVIEAPHDWNADVDSTGRDHQLFLAGGITNCSDWQSEMIGLLEDFDGVIFNPRRRQWPRDSESLSEQIHWEQTHLDRSHLRLFWFAQETVCPITLFELGNALGKSQSIVIGADPNYCRREDLKIQLSLIRPDLVIANSILQLSKQVIEYFDSRSTTEPQ